MHFQALIKGFVKFFGTFWLQEIKYIWASCIIGKLLNYLTLILADQFALISTKNVK